MRMRIGLSVKQHYVLSSAGPSDEEESKTARNRRREQWIGMQPTATRRWILLSL